jgi:Rnl2 family RNA ligase
MITSGESFLVNTLNKMKQQSKKNYASIKKPTDGRTVEYFRQHFTDCNWYCTEKVHGCNFSFVWDGEKVSYLSREAVIDGVETKCYNHSAFVDEMTHKVLELANIVNRPFQLVTEYYGAEIMQNQAYIDYGLGEGNKDFIAYDLRYINDDTWASKDELYNLCEQVNIPTTAVLFEGSFDECLKFNPVFESPLAKGNGVTINAEGFVMKPVLGLVDSANGNKVALKVTTTAFAEEKLQPALLKQRLAKEKELALKERTRKVVLNMLTPVRVGKVIESILSNEDAGELTEAETVEKIRQIGKGKMILKLNADIKNDYPSNQERDEAVIKNECIMYVRRYLGEI